MPIGVETASIWLSRTPIISVFSPMGMNTRLDSDGPMDPRQGGRLEQERNVDEILRSVRVKNRRECSGAEKHTSRNVNHAFVRVVR